MGVTCSLVKDLVWPKSVHRTPIVKPGVTSALYMGSVIGTLWNKLVLSAGPGLEMCIKFK